MRRADCSRSSNEHDPGVIGRANETDEFEIRVIND